MSNKDEIWRIHPRYSRYKISNYGGVYDRINEAYPSSHVGKQSGARSVNVKRDSGVRSSVLVHRLVAETFHPKWVDQCEVGFLDNDKLNTHIDNLFIRLNGRVRGSNEGRKILVEETGEIYDRVSEITEKYKYQKSEIVRVLSGKRDKYQGYTFRYIRA